MRKIPLTVGEYYHVFNRGIDRRNIISDLHDTERFMESILMFNTKKPIGSIHEARFLSRSRHSQKNATLIPHGSRLVDIIAYCLNPNHYHFILTPLTDRGIEHFMQRLGNGYTKYFNERHTRIGPLFSGRFRANHVPTNEELLRLSAYVNRNSEIHHLGHRMSKLARSSWDEYRNRSTLAICNREIITNQFSKRGEYIRYCYSVVTDTKKRRMDLEIVP